MVMTFVGERKDIQGPEAGRSCFQTDIMNTKNIHRRHSHIQGQNKLLQEPATEKKSEEIREGAPSREKHQQTLCRKFLIICCLGLGGTTRLKYARRAHISVSHDIFSLHELQKARRGVPLAF